MIIDNLDDAVVAAIKQGCVHFDQILKNPRVHALGIGLTHENRAVANALRRLKRARFIIYVGSRLGWRIVIEESLPATLVGIVDSTCE